MAIRVFLADDHGIVRDGLRFLLEAQPDISVVGDASDGRQAVHQVSQLRPNVAVIDIAMPELNGIEAAQQIRRICPDTKIIILSMYSTHEHIARSFQAGALGYLLKESAGAELVDAIRTVHAGNHYLSRKITDIVIDDYVRLRPEAETSPLERLSPREREVLQLVVEGRSGTEIADKLSVSPKSVATYRSRIMHKLDIHDLLGLLKFAFQHGITPPQ
jgi:DNA-binding NarL/FixJ family response regulator